jgi:flagellar basal body-associated protein FliL
LKRAAISLVVVLVLAAVAGGIVYFQYFLKPGLVAKVVAERTGGVTPVAAEPAKTED